MSIRLLPPEQRIIRKIAEKALYPTRDVFLTAARLAFDQVDLAALTRIIEESDPAKPGSIYTQARIRTLIGEFQLNLLPILEKLLLRAGAAGLPVFSEVMRFPRPVGIDTFQRLIEPAAKQVVAAAVKNIGAATRQAIRTMVTEGFEQGLSPKKIASQIKGTIGLDERRAKAFNRWLDELQANPPDLDEKQLQRMIDAEYKRHLESRAMAIARTEVSSVAAAAQTLIWESALDEGKLSPTSYVREWVRIPAAKPCPICGPLQGKRARLRRGYYLGAKGKKYLRPPGHTNCRCGERLVAWRASDAELPEKPLAAAA